MSLIATWLITHANLVAVKSHGELWEIEDKRVVKQLVEQFSCQQLEPLNQNYFCRLEFDEFWHLQNLNGAFYAQSFRLNQQPQRSQKTWLGERLIAQGFDNYFLEIFSSEHKARTLADGFSFRFGARLVSMKEIEHGRFHILLDKPETSVLLVQQHNITHSIQITTRTKSR